LKVSGYLRDLNVRQNINIKTDIDNTGRDEVELFKMTHVGSGGWL
jgi:hypothetical protein